MCLFLVGNVLKCSQPFKENADYPNLDLQWDILQFPAGKKKPNSIDQHQNTTYAGH